MRYTRVYTGPDGETHFEDAETRGETIRAAESDLVGTVSESFPVKAVYFREVREESSPVPHNAPHPLFIAGEPGREEFESDTSAELRILRQIDFTHAAAPERGDDLVMAESGSGDDVHRIQLHMV